MPFQKILICILIWDIAHDILKCVLQFVFADSVLMLCLLHWIGINMCYFKSSFVTCDIANLLDYYYGYDKT